tara:strand:+ start:12236 stop:13036 length:801 start_codon:yes stop_codon:yes gene_type:complete
METYNNYQNKDDVLFRNIIVGALHALDDRIFWNNVIDNVKTKVDVPAYFTIAGSERFMSDIFLNSDELKSEGKATGLYEKFPRATLNLTGITLEEEYLVNKFKRANFIKQTSDNEVKEYNAEFTEAPFKLAFEVTIHVDSIVDIFKCINSVFSNLYKNVYFYVDVFSVKVPCYFAIPPDLNKERLVQFGLSDKKEIMITFPIEVQASYPMFKSDTEIFAGDRLENLKQNLYIVSEKGDATDSAGRNIKVKKDVWPTGNNTSTNFTE